MSKLYAIKDAKVGAYINIMMFKNDSVAIREFQAAANEKNRNMVNEFPEDKELWCLGTFDELTGVIVPEVKYMNKAVDFIVKE